jgi:hypothetical protein
MATSGDDSMLNATLVSALPPPMISSMNDNNSQQAAPSSYQDLIKNLDIKQMTSGQSMPPMPAAIQMQQQMPRQTQQQMPQQMPQQMSMQQMMPQQMMPTPDNAMEMLHSQNSTYPGSMPQSAPVGEYASGPSMDMAQGPIVNSLLPDPMFFNPPPQERKRRRPPPPPPAVAPPQATMLGGKVPAMDLNKIKPAILVAAIVFALLSWGAPVVAKQLTWTVDAMTGKFTSSGLIIISLLTGGIYLGISEIIRNFGNGV